MPVKRPRQNKPGQKFGAKKKSWVWVWFVQDSTDSNIAACDYCGKIIVRLASDKGSPKKLSEHLKVHKLDRHSINYSRSVPMDGFGVTYNHNGQVMAQVQHQDAIMEPSTKKQKTSDPDLASNPFELGASSRYLCADFDNSPYSTMKFHKHLLKFLTDNKLPISVIKSQSFQQIVYDLRSNSIEDLLELTGLYNSLIEVSGYGPREGNNESENPINALTNVVARASK
ncbi:uncharacterized protein SPAPADRAFT_142226 [Spathaspora passalidarum NRRL Y-27907]|uniref:BED-type domain-containing protein n=1 Tax=Spathaspora passalidarum (strain NRRL Y-27907 / 11-Y1) TaxID=619300 RepID=G3ATI2_SPAPN|nr:uncharacterized protein SPAPADRAFT_142226 [Spathaspora passalidarum NRRL Y-27907]EGW30945.1 hypothetical protein SPAPADRAFT_142226 [Spathaspora passalidarum NRRL Y-27907]